MVWGMKRVKKRRRKIIQHQQVAAGCVKNPCGEKLPLSMDPYLSC
jgi:hypothetical protein